MKNQKAIYMKPESSIHYVFAECEGLTQVSKTESNGTQPPAFSGDGNGDGMNDAKNRTGWFFWDDEDDAAK